MTESQNIEYKTSWRDEYLKWISGFANAYGGKIYIGIDDNGKVVGLPEVQKLMEDIPNKIINYLGIVADVNLLESEGKKYLEIIVSTSSVPISYKGTFYYRTGSTKQELKGNALHQFLLKRLGRKWDDLPCENATLEDIDYDAIRYFFKKASISKRLAENIGIDDLKTTLENLDLVTGNNKLKNAALLLFGKRPSRFFPSVSFKIGRFIDSDDDLRFQDVVEGNILQMADKVMDILKSKYLISPIHYTGLQRIEQLDVPEEALREAIFNSIIHKDYTGAPIQLSVYNDKLILWNEGRLPEDFTIETLLEKHPSRPANKNIADIFFKAGFIEAWGRGIAKIINGFITAGLTAPEFKATMGGIMVTIKRDVSVSDEKSNAIGNVVDDVVDDVVNNVVNNVPEIRLIKILNLIAENKQISAAQIAQILNTTGRTVQRDIEKLKKRNILKRIGSVKGGHWELVNREK
jgi:ATP-dependent DNA helicase RecG